MKAAAVIATLILAIGGVIWGANGHWVPRTVAQEAHDDLTEEIQLVSSRLQGKIKADEISYLERDIMIFERRIWRYQDRFGDNCGKRKSDCRELRSMINKAKRDLTRKRR